MEAQSLKSLYHGPAQSGSWNSENLATLQGERLR